MAAGDLELQPGLRIPAHEITETASRASGPGGQHVNKTSTRVTLRWNLLASEALDARQRGRLRERLAHRLTRSGNLVVHAERHRSRTRNREQARARLAELVRDGLRTDAPRRATKPSRSARVRRLEGKRQRSALKRRRGRVSPDSD